MAEAPRLPPPCGWFVPALAALLPACSEHVFGGDAALLAAYPEGKIFDSLETREMQVGDPAPAFLRGDGQLDGHGVQIPLRTINPDGSRPVHKWGLWVTYYRNGLERAGKESEGEFRDNHREGSWTFWYRAGTKRAQGTFSNRRMTGRWECWREDGSVDTEHAGIYRDGERIEP